MAYTSTDLENIRAAIASGERTVQIGDRMTTFRSMEELLQAESRITRALETPRSRQFVGVPGKGL